MKPSKIEIAQFFNSGWKRLYYENEYHLCRRTISCPRSISIFNKLNDSLNRLESLYREKNINKLHEDIDRTDGGEIYLLSNLFYCGNNLLFWKHGGRGYSTDYNTAQRFTLDEVKPILKSGKYRAWKLSYLKTKIKRTIDIQDLDNNESL